jgi:hypothetical protein
MIIFNTNLINDSNKDLCTVVHYFSPEKNRAACSLQDIKFLERYLGHTLDFSQYPSYNKVSYHTPKQEDEVRLNTLSTNLFIREIIKPKSKKDKLLFKKV